MILTKTINALILSSATLSAMSCGQTMDTKTVPLATQIAQKIMIDLRYYCDQATNDNVCRKPLTKLPSAIAKVISESNVGGVILFADNLDNTEQIVTLNHDLQQAAAKSSFASPLFLSVDQEGGRVFRSPRAETIAFTGNMAIGATYHQHGTFYAHESARVIGEELTALGFNVNHAPTIDVNSNPLNPVINVRSFGEDPNIVAHLGQAQIQAFQQQGIIGTLKHFPGHGDTATDSHTGLPRVDHDLAIIVKNDLAPFKQIIDNHAPGMIMTAHIQYPNLDSSTFISTDGKELIKPATMSRKIITDILRGELNYKGVVITDALDMAGIRHFFNQYEAVVKTFQAGVDIALMPIKIRTADDLEELTKLINYVVAAIDAGELDKDEIHASFLRVQQLKADYQLEHQLKQNLPLAIKAAKQSLMTAKNVQIESRLAEDSITLVSGIKSTLPLKSTDKVHLIMPDQAKCLALTTALTKNLPGIKISCTSAQSFNKQAALLDIAKADVVIGGHIAPKQSAVEMGGMDDLVDNQAKLSKITGPEAIYDLLSQAKGLAKKVIFVSLRTPYEIAHFSKVSDLALATYAYNTHINSVSKTVDSPALSALAKVLSGNVLAKGKLPVSIDF